MASKMVIGAVVAAAIVVIAGVAVLGSNGGGNGGGDSPAPTPTPSHGVLYNYVLAECTEFDEKYLDGSGQPEVKHAPEGKKYILASIQIKVQKDTASTTGSSAHLRIGEAVTECSLDYSSLWCFTGHENVRAGESKCYPVTFVVDSSASLADMSLYLQQTLVDYSYDSTLEVEKVFSAKKPA